MNESPAPSVTIRVSGKLFESHVAYLEQLVQSARGCGLWAVLDLAMLAEADCAAVRFLMSGEDQICGISSCPAFVREWIARERDQSAA